MAIGNRSIRALALCLFSHQGRILVNEAIDPANGQRFCRPLGGGIEFGEPSIQTIVREIREEIGADIEHLRWIGTLENIFTYQGELGHQIVQVYDGEFSNKAFYHQSQIPGTESDGHRFTAVWRDLDTFTPEMPLVPQGLLSLIKNQSGF